MKTLYYLLALLSFSCTQQTNSKTTKESIEEQMKEQEICWNNGDLKCFMQYYWKSDSLTFIGKSGINYGWEKTLNNYLSAYKTKDEMGILHFKNLIIEELSPNYTYVI